MTERMFLHEALGFNSALVIFKSGAKCRDWERSRALMSDCLQHLDKTKCHVPMIHRYNE